MEKGFKDYKLSKEILETIEMLDYKTPTKVQEKVIPIALEGRDLVVRSQTGSGKTAAFAVPVCELVDWEENKPQALVITPTRELAMQVREDFFNIGRFKRLKVVSVYGRAPFYNQQQELKQKTHVVVGTTGRIMDHIDRGTLDVSMVEYLIIDEADEMFNMGFLDQVEDIIDVLPKDRLTMLFSATLPRDIESLCDKYMKDPKYIEIEDESAIEDKIDQWGYRIEERDKMELLKDVTILESPDSCIMFANTRERVDEIFEELEYENYTCDKIHGGMEQRDRTKVMEDFRQGYFRYLVATDVAARGIDIDNISHVINYDLPMEAESYVHRIGRTGRIDNTGIAITCISNRDQRLLNDIERYIEMEIPVKKRPSKEDIEELREAFEEKMRKTSVVKEQKGEELNKGILKLHINAGRKTKMRPTDIVGTLCNIEGMTVDDIGIINVLDISTFVEVLNGKGEMVLEKLQTKPIKGRLRNVNIANE